MKKTFFFVVLLSVLLFSCATTGEDTGKSEDVYNDIQQTLIPEVTPEPEPVITEGPVPVIEEEPDVIIVIEEESVSEETLPEPEPAEEIIDDQTIPEPEPEIEVPEPVETPLLSEEYLRSISNLSDKDVIIVSPEVFEEDKNQIFQIINALDQIMKKKDFEGWLTYLTPESAEYWSNRHNLLELSRHLFSVDVFQINNMREYFEFFFIPARRGRLVDEIRYVTIDLVKVVQYKNKTDVIYYFFERQNGIWKLTLDTL